MRVVLLLPFLVLTCRERGFFYSKVQGLIPSGVTFGGQGNQVFSQLSDAFMRCVSSGAFFFRDSPFCSSGVYAVEYLLTQPLSVNVISGQLDIIVDALCTEQWINNMTWSGLPQYKQAAEQFITIGGVPQGAYRTYQNFSFYKVFRAGHSESQFVVFDFVRI